MASRKLSKSACGCRKTQLPLSCLFLFDNSKHYSSNFVSPLSFPVVCEVLWISSCYLLNHAYLMKIIILRFTNLTHGERKNKGANENILGCSSLLVLPLGFPLLLCFFIVVSGVLKPHPGTSATSL